MDMKLLKSQRNPQNHSQIVDGFITEIAKGKKTKRDLQNVLKRMFAKEVKEIEKNFKNVPLSPTTLLSKVLPTEMILIFKEHTDTLAVLGLHFDAQAWTISDLSNIPLKSLNIDVFGGFSSWHIHFLVGLVGKMGLSFQA